MPTTFDPKETFAQAEHQVLLIAAERRDKVDADTRQALAFAWTYADHLAGGGDPTVYPEPDTNRWNGGSDYVSRFAGLEVVYDYWNAARGGRHSVRPFRNERAYRAIELLTREIGTPVSFADLSDAWKTGRGYASERPSGDTIAKLALDCESPDLVARKTKVDGKVAYLIRERRPDDPAEDSYRADAIPTEKV
jgi:hypothetical protein